MTVADPITVAITRRVPPDRTREAEAWLRSGQDLVAGMPGYLGSGWVRSGPDEEQWHVLYRFRDPESLAAWEASSEREWWLASAAGIAEDSRMERRTGIEGWFDASDSVLLDASPPPAPPRWKQMISIFIVFYPLSLTIQFFAAPILLPLELWLRVGITTVIATPLMTYLLLPFVTRALRPWLLRGRVRSR